MLPGHAKASFRDLRCQPATNEAWYCSLYAYLRTLFPRDVRDENPTFAPMLLGLQLATLSADCRGLALREVRSMIEGWFTKPVSVAVGISGDVWIVENARSAINLLTSHWRGQGSEKYKTAMRACQGAVRGEVSPEIARQAFIDAASEVRVLAD